jgi:hypothetical protein
MAVRLKVAAWAVVVLLWLAELAEICADPNLLRPAVDMLLDSATAVATIALIGWTLTAAVVTAVQERAESIEDRLDAQDEAWTTWRAATGQRPVLRVAGEPEKR